MIVSHGTCAVSLDGVDLLLDSSMLTDEPPQLRTDATTTIEHPVFETSAEPVEAGWLLHFSPPTP